MSTNPVVISGSGHLGQCLAMSPPDFRHAGHSVLYSGVQARVMVGSHGRLVSFKTKDGCYTSQSWV